MCLSQISTDLRAKFKELGSRQHQVGIFHRMAVTATATMTVESAGCLPSSK